MKRLIVLICMFIHICACNSETVSPAWTEGKNEWTQTGRNNEFNHNSSSPALSSLPTKQESKQNVTISDDNVIETIQDPSEWGGVATSKSKKTGTQPDKSNLPRKAVLPSSPSYPVLITAQCGKDTDCKGDRICVDGNCENPAKSGERDESKKAFSYSNSNIDESITKYLGDWLIFITSIAQKNSSGQIVAHYAVQGAIHINVAFTDRFIITPTADGLSIKNITYAGDKLFYTIYFKSGTEYQCVWSRVNSKEDDIQKIYDGKNIKRGLFSDEIWDLEGSYKIKKCTDFKEDKDGRITCSNPI